VAIAAGSVLGSGGRAVDTGATGCGPVPAAHGLALIAALPADRNALVPLAPQVVALCPDTSYPSAHTELVEPVFAPATQRPPPPTHDWPFA